MMEEIKKELLNLKDDKYQKFAASINPDVKNLLGIRIPILRKLAKKILKSGYETFLKENDDEFFELTILEGFILSELDFDIKKIENFIKKITSWAICDSFCSSCKKIKNHKKEVKALVEKYLKSSKEYEQRFCYVILLNYFLDEMDYVLEKIKLFNNESYYAKMAAAWALSYCFMKDFNKTKDFLLNNKIHPWVLKKGIQKTFDSYQITKEQKELLKKLFS